MEANGHNTPNEASDATADSEASGSKVGATLNLTGEQSSWLADHLEDVVRSAPVNTEGIAHQIVSKLHAQGY